MLLKLFFDISSGLGVMVEKPAKGTPIYVVWLGFPLTRVPKDAAVAALGDRTVPQGMSFFLSGQGLCCVKISEQSNQMESSYSQKADMRTFSPGARYLPVVLESQNWSHFLRLVKSYIVLKFWSIPIKWSWATAEKLILLIWCRIAMHNIYTCYLLNFSTVWHQLLIF